MQLPRFALDPLIHNCLTCLTCLHWTTEEVDFKKNLIRMSVGFPIGGYCRRSLDVDHHLPGFTAQVEMEGKLSIQSRDSFCLLLWTSRWEDGNRMDQRSSMMLWHALADSLPGLHRILQSCTQEGNTWIEFRWGMQPLSATISHSWIQKYSKRAKDLTIPPPSRPSPCFQSPQPIMLKACSNCGWDQFQINIPRHWKMEAATAMSSCSALSHSTGNSLSADLLCLESRHCRWWVSSSIWGTQFDKCKHVVSQCTASHRICRLSIQQHQHALLLEQKDEEIAHMKARICLDAVTSRGKGACDLFASCNDHCLACPACSPKLVPFLGGFFWVSEISWHRMSFELEGVFGGRNCSRLFDFWVWTRLTSLVPWHQDSLATCRFRKAHVKIDAEKKHDMRGGLSCWFACGHGSWPVSLAYFALRPSIVFCTLHWQYPFSCQTKRQHYFHALSVKPIISYGY